MQKILVVTSRVPWPLDKGDKLRAYHQIKSLSANAEIYLFCTNDAGEIPEALEELNKFCKEVKIVPLPKIKIAFNLAFAYFKDIPFQAAYFYNSTAQHAFNNFIDKVKPDAIYCQLIRTALFVQNRKEYKVLDYMDAFSKGMERRMDKFTGIKRLIFRMESQRLRSFETKVFEWFNEKIIISDQDKKLIEHPKREGINTIPNGVDVGFFKPDPTKKEFDIIFSGNMNYPPNIEAAEYLCKKILPIINSRGKKFKVLISGTSPAEPVKSLANDQVIISGWVQDIRENYSKSKILVAPMQSSIGLQNKLLEAMAMGLPCITSSLANNALQAKAGTEILTADSPEEYSEKILQLLSDEKQYREFSIAGLNFVQTKYSWDNFNRKLFELLLKNVSSQA